MTDTQPRGEIVIGGGNVALGKIIVFVCTEKTLLKLVSTKFLTFFIGSVLENDFWTPPRTPPASINFVHDHFFNNFQLN